jgi:1-acyl-sn-glycerol-3-phosphate acyltransferase
VLRATPEQLAPLSRMERFAFRFADVFNRRFAWLSHLWNRTFMVVVLRLTAARRIRAYGLERIAALDHSDRLVMVANHRSFFDYFTVMHVLFQSTQMSSRILFPVRSAFFYDSPVGIAVNFLMSGMAMFPPVLRDPAKRMFNQYAVARIVSELQVPGRLVGFHPEGTRQRGGDPYRFLPVRPGVGEVIQRAGPGVKVLPIFVLGIDNDLPREAYRNWFRRDEHPIDIVFGDPVDAADLCLEPDGPEAHLAIANHCVDLVAALGEYQREHGRAIYRPD